MRFRRAERLTSKVVNDGKQVSMNEWELAAHNLSVQMWYRQVISHWEDQCRLSEDLVHGKTLLASSRLSSAMFASLKGKEAWVVFCPHPKCRHLVHRQELQIHFQTHGVPVRKKQTILENFGYKGVCFGCFPIQSLKLSLLPQFCRIPIRSDISTAGGTLCCAHCFGTASNDLS